MENKQAKGMKCPFHHIFGYSSNKLFLNSMEKGKKITLIIKMYLELQK
jgi:hypothetical protein